jgi:hypothetical protein
VFIFYPEELEEDPDGYPEELEEDPSKLADWYPEELEPLGRSTRCFTVLPIA